MSKTADAPDPDPTQHAIRESWPWEKRFSEREGFSRFAHEPVGGFARPESLNWPQASCARDIYIETGTGQITRRSSSCCTTRNIAVGKCWPVFRDDDRGVDQRKRQVRRCAPQEQNRVIMRDLCDAFAVYLESDDFSESGGGKSRALTGPTVNSVC
jgi:hypothetical protein